VFVLANDMTYDKLGLVEELPHPWPGAFGNATPLARHPRIRVPLLASHEVPARCASGPNIEGRSCYLKDGRPDVALKGRENRRTRRRRDFKKPRHLN
jgi:hypothetical protein